MLIVALCHILKQQLFRVADFAEWFVHTELQRRKRRRSPIHFLHRRLLRGPQAQHFYALDCQTLSWLNHQYKREHICFFDKKSKAQLSVKAQRRSQLRLPRCISARSITCYMCHWQRAEAKRYTVKKSKKNHLLMCCSVSNFAFLGCWQQRGYRGQWVMQQRPVNRHEHRIYGYMVSILNS